MNSWLNDLKVITQILRPSFKSDNLATRLENRYFGQAKEYDGFRKKLLHGREPLLDQIIPEKFDGVWIDVGGGTGFNVEYAYPRLSQNSKVFIVDLCSSLLEVASQRFAKKNIENVFCINEDATSFSLPVKADIITFSYSLTMIPPWYKAIDHASSYLNHNGRIGIVDFYKPSKYDQHNNSWIKRIFLPLWFQHDDVYLSADHIPYLQYKFEQISLKTDCAKVPYTPFYAPYYTFIGKILPILN